MLNKKEEFEFIKIIHDSGGRANASLIIKFKELLNEHDKNVLGEVKKKLSDWYSERQKARGIRAWTDDYFSQGDTLSGTIIPIIDKLIP